MLWSLFNPHRLFSFEKFSIITIVKKQTLTSIETEQACFASTGYEVWRDAVALGLLSRGDRAARGQELRHQRLQLWPAHSSTSHGKAQTP